MSCIHNIAHKQDAETLVRKMFPAYGGHNGESIPLVIEFISGFEYFNTRPYHNYETWGQGFRVRADTHVVENECLLCALEGVSRKVLTKE